MNPCSSPLIGFWLAMIGADLDWPIPYASRIDGCLLPWADEEQSYNAHKSLGEGAQGIVTSKSLSNDHQD
jgi:hypothetical protein